MTLKQTNFKGIASGKLFVALGSTRHHAKWLTFTEGETLAENDKPEGLYYVEVNSLKEASILTQKFIEYFGLSSSNWTGGRVCDENLNFVARVSFNGRIWDNDDFKICKEIDL
jgi:hypothetical protein